MTLRLSAARAREFWHALMANAVGLIEDAATLLAAGSAGRAQSLLVLALEELARADAVYWASLTAWEGEADTVELAPVEEGGKHLSVSNSHRDKIEHAERNALNLGPFWGDYSGWAPGEERPVPRVPKEVDEAKQAGFYVANRQRNGGGFASPLDIEKEPVTAELERVAQLAEMALIEDHTRKQDLGTATEDSAQDLHWKVIPYAHREMFRTVYGDLRDAEPETGD
ncbi:AbiV family abortive infection protein [Tsukamurella paurometabola]|uniref:AbiV family abortive infection protein n=1 Tax=Tsukamurella paurometabola TaxID=2061 RepID=A0A3P8K761_TSUPA|nr:AbiV family abortive infection protein [Tsukamurella paurometabola]UEA84029.1 AbiV family abortive infection protein [Tsukamurella paurometabola]VDR41189.1 Uncharacterised protein [Tsukamurella paurometabola]